MIYGQKQAETKEFTYWGEWKQSAHEMVILSILAEYENYGKSFMLDPMALRIGFSYRGHPKFNNIYNSIVIISSSNQIY